jgi:hypothetical protein
MSMATALMFCTSSFNNIDQAVCGQIIDGGIVIMPFPHCKVINAYILRFYRISIVNSLLSMVIKKPLELVLVKHRKL